PHTIGMHEEITDGARMLRLGRAERTLIRARWAGAVFAAVQILTYYLPYPGGVIGLAASLVLLLAVGNTAIRLTLGRVSTPTHAKALAVAGLALDVVVVMGLVLVYTFDVDTAMWAAVYVLPLEGAIKFQLAGSFWTMAIATALYTVREVFGALAYGNPFLATSISFRMGVGFIIAGVAGAMASSLLRERNELEVAKAELERAGEIKDDFLAMTNHELRTPLTTILGYTAMLQRRWSTLEDGYKRDAVTAIAEQSERLRDLVEDLLTISSAQAGALQLEVEPVALAAVVNDAIGLLPAADVENACSDSLWVLADRRRLGQILSNYLSNARKYGAAPFAIEAYEEAGSVVLKVVDSGPGVPDTFMPRLFEKFSQASVGASRTAEGTGLGLAIVRQLAQAQGGEVWYERGTPGGSRFCLRLRSAATTPNPCGSAGMREKTWPLAD
ncbi:MAG: sensor histidine kinase, partial [Egibacteraceae bacterium]